jgi:hypothetical protein
VKIENPNSHVASFDEDPVLNRIQLSLGSAGGNVGAFATGAANAGGSQGAAIMNQLVGLMTQRSSQGGVRQQSQEGSSAGPAVAAGLGGLALGAAGGALLGGALGKKAAAAANAGSMPSSGTGASAPTPSAPASAPQADKGAAPQTTVTQQPPSMPAPTPPQAKTAPIQTQPTVVKTATTTPQNTSQTSGGVGHARPQVSLGADGGWSVTKAPDILPTDWTKVGTPNGDLVLPNGLLGGR